MSSGVGRLPEPEVGPIETTVCVMSLDGTIVKEAVVPTDPEAIVACLVDNPGQLERIGLEAGPMSEWLVRGLADLGLSVVLMETRQVRAALSAMIVKTDRKDARGMAHLLRTGWFRPVHVKTPDAREQRAMLSARATLVARLKDIVAAVLDGERDDVGGPSRLLVRGRGNLALRRAVLPKHTAGHALGPTHIRWRTTPSLRASATLARLAPRRFATFMAHALILREAAAGNF